MPICRKCNNYERFVSTHAEYYTETYDRDGDIIDRDWIDSDHMETYCDDCESTNIEHRMSVDEWEKAHGLAKMEDY